VRPAFPAIRSGEKIHADQSAARHHDHRQSIFAVAQFMRNKIFDISLANENLLLVVRDIFEVAGVLRAGLRSVNDLAAGPKDPMGFERERRTLLIHRRIRIGFGLRRNKICHEQQPNRDHARAQLHESSQARQASRQRNIFIPLVRSAMRLSQLGKGTF
jgi:hypothetical protein